MFNSDIDDIANFLGRFEDHVRSLSVSRCDFSFWLAPLLQGRALAVMQRLGDDK